MTEFSKKSQVSHNAEILQIPTVMKRLNTRRSVKLLRDYTDSAQLNLNSTDDLHNYIDQNTTVSWSSIFLSVFSIISSLSDFGSDIFLIITYFNQNHLIWFMLTLLFVIIPSIIQSCFSIIWYWNDQSCTFTVTGWSVRIGLHLILLAPIARYTDTLIYSWKCKHAKTDMEKLRFYKLMLYEEADSALLRVLECSMESVPQLLLQMFILFTQPRMKDNTVVMIQIASIILSMISLAWCLTSYQSSLRLTTEGKKHMSTISMILMVFWKLLIIFPRFLSIALFTSVFRLYILVMLGLHYFIMSIYIISQKTTFFSEKSFSFREIMFNFVMAAIYCVDFLNVTEGITRYKYAFYYGISFGEIVILMIIWYLNTPFERVYFDSPYYSSTDFNSTNNSTILSQKNFYYQFWSDSIRKFVLLETIGCFILGIFFMIIYFVRFHPTNNIKIFIKKKKIYLNTAGDNVIRLTESNPTSCSTES